MRSNTLLKAVDKTTTTYIHGSISMARISLG